MEWVLVVIVVVTLLLVISITGRNRQAERARQAQLNRLETKLDAAIGQQQQAPGVSTPWSVQPSSAQPPSGQEGRPEDAESARPETFGEGPGVAPGQGYAYPSYGEAQPAAPMPGGVPGGVRSPHQFVHDPRFSQDPRLAEVDRLVRDGRKIQAIKVYREVTGVGLREAKEAVERISG